MKSKDPVKEKKSRSLTEEDSGVKKRTDIHLAAFHRWRGGRQGEMPRVMKTQPSELLSCDAPVTLFFPNLLLLTCSSF